MKKALTLDDAVALLIQCEAELTDGERNLKKVENQLSMALEYFVESVSTNTPE